MKVDYRSGDGVRSGGSHTLTKAEQKQVDDAKRRNQTEVTVNASGKTAKKEEKPVVEENTDINEDTEE